MVRCRNYSSSYIFKWRLYLFLLILVILLAVLQYGYHVSLGRSSESSDGGIRYVKLEQKRRVADGPVKVLQVAYMRGGSSLLGQLFYQNPEAFYWFEPLDGLYSHLYGVMPAVIPMKFSHYNNGSVRILPAFEEEAVVDSIADQLACNIDQIPVDILTHPYIFTAAPTPAYRNCMKSDKRSNVSNKTPVINHQAYGNCQEMLSSVCSYKPDLPETCYRSLRHQEEWEPNGPFVRHNLCLSRSKLKMNSCLQHLKSACRQSKIRAIKALRITMKTVAKIKSEVSNLKIIHYVRDPRAILKARQAVKKLSPYAKGSVIKEAYILCAKMLENINVFRELQTKYPDETLQVRYEDVVMQPDVTITRLYEFLGTKPPETVITWLKNHLNASRSSGNYSYSRTNGTATALAWKTVLSEVDIKGSTCMCQEVLKELGYSLNN